MVVFSIFPQKILYVDSAKLACKILHWRIK